jgi:signal transduction histidine kinase
LILVIARDFSEGGAAESATRGRVHLLHPVDRQRENLLLRVVTGPVEKRQTIPEEVHSDAIQMMTAAIRTLSILRRSIIDPEEVRLLAQTERRVKAALARLRNLAFELRPPALEKTGLSAALDDYLGATLAGTGVQWHVEDQTSEGQPLETQLVLYRIAQEAVSNIVKHAAATRVEIALLEREDGFTLRITDDGIGLSPSEDLSPGRLGLTCMKDRAELAGGWCRVDTAPGMGTTIECWVPGPRWSLFGNQADAQNLVPVGDQAGAGSIWGADGEERDHVSATG